MRCPQCGCTNDKVIDSRTTKENDCIRRRRECTQCNTRFTTHEMIVKTELVIIKRDGTREEYLPEKLRAGIEHACWKRQISQNQIDDMLSQINQKLYKIQEREVKSEILGELTMEVLQKIDRVAYIRFASVYRKFKDVDEFIEEVQNLTEND